MYRLQTHSYPNHLSDLLTLELEDFPTLDEIPTDPWGNNYIYLRVSDSEFKLYSYGADETMGGVGDNRDINYTDDAEDLCV